MWSSRLVKSLQSLGHEAEVRTNWPLETDKADVAIVNLGEGPLPATKLIARLQELKIKTIGHAGHKEKDLHQLGKDAGCDILATNSELTFKLAELLERAK
ncbi:MAG TPA: hypothetical protein VGE01_03335 [Fimbriimonas sp.]